MIILFKTLSNCSYLDNFFFCVGTGSKSNTLCPIAFFCTLEPHFSLMQLGWVVSNLQLIKGLFKVQTPFRISSPNYFSFPRMASGHRGSFLSLVLLAQASASRASFPVALQLAPERQPPSWLLWPLACLCKCLSMWLVAGGITH